MLTERSFGGKRGFVDFVIYEFYRYLRQGRAAPKTRSTRDKRKGLPRFAFSQRIRKPFLKVELQRDRFDPLSRQTFLQNHV